MLFSRFFLRIAKAIYARSVITARPTREPMAMPAIAPLDRPVSVDVDVKMFPAPVGEDAGVEPGLADDGASTEELDVGYSVINIS